MCIGIVALPKYFSCFKLKLTNLVNVWYNSITEYMWIIGWRISSGNPGKGQSLNKSNMMSMSLSVCLFEPQDLANRWANIISLSNVAFHWSSERFITILLKSPLKALPNFVSSFLIETLIESKGGSIYTIPKNSM